jgi:hypothetical protein
MVLGTPARRCHGQRSKIVRRLEDVLEERRPAQLDRDDLPQVMQRQAALAGSPDLLSVPSDRAAQSKEVEKLLHATRVVAERGSDHLHHLTNLLRLAHRYAFFLLWCIGG